MNDRDNSLHSTKLYTGQNINMIDGIINHAPVIPSVAIPSIKPLDKVKEIPHRKRSMERER